MIALLVVVVVVGFLAYLVERVVPMDDTIRVIFRALVVLAVVLYVLQALGVYTLPLHVR